MKKLYNFLASFSLKLIAILSLSLPLTSNAQESMRANLFVVDAVGTTLIDGNLTNYDNIYSNAVDIYDGWKMTNPGINFGILRNGYNLAVERRSLITDTDTTYFRMWNMPQLHYRIKFMLKNLGHPGLQAILNDSYLNSEIPIGLNDTTYLDFTVNSDPASANEMRFKLIYKTIVAMPFSFTGITAHRIGKKALLEWSVINQGTVESFKIEQSVDGIVFKDLSQLHPDNSSSAKSYEFEDQGVNSDIKFYRVKAIIAGGNTIVSQAVKIDALITNSEISIYPNPVVDKAMQVRFMNQDPGNYSLQLTNRSGQMIYKGNIELDNNYFIKTIKLGDSALPGTYLLNIISAEGIKITRQVIIL